MKRRNNLIQDFIYENALLVLSWIVILLMGYELHKVYQDLDSLIPPPTVDHRIDSLKNVVNQITVDYSKLKHDYDSAQSHIKQDIKYIYIKNAKDISNIRIYTTIQRDSMWTTFKP